MRYSEALIKRNKAQKGNLLWGQKKMDQIGLELDMRKKILFKTTFKIWWTTAEDWTVDAKSGKENMDYWSNG